MSEAWGGRRRGHSRWRLRPRRRAFLGIYVGRRQTTDQAQVEHAQWLRGQRQEAYIKFLEAWEKAVVEYKQFEDQPEAWFQMASAVTA